MVYARINFNATPKEKGEGWVAVRSTKKGGTTGVPPFTSRRDQRNEVKSMISLVPYLSWVTIPSCPSLRTAFDKALPVLPP